MDDFHCEITFFFSKGNMISGKSLERPVVHHWLSYLSSPQPLSGNVSYSFSPSGKPLMKTSRMTVINTEKPTVTVDIGSTVKTVQGVNVTINCQVAGEKFTTMFIHSKY